MTPLIYLLLTAWTLAFVLVNRPAEGLFGLALIGAGLLFYRLSRFSSPAPDTPVRAGEKVG